MRVNVGIQTIGQNILDTYVGKQLSSAATDRCLINTGIIKMNI
jgi:hypothetical protein